MFLTFDVGTSSVKTALVDREGRLLASASREYGLQTPMPGWFQVDPEVYWRGVLDGFREILATAGRTPSAVRGICGSSQGETVIFLDSAGEPTYPAIVWLDTRAQQEARTLADEFSPSEFYSTTGIVAMGPNWTSAKILWLQRHEPEAFARTAKILLVEDYIVWRLTGRLTAAASLWATSGLVNITTGNWWSAVVSRLCLEGKLPALVGELSVVAPVLQPVGQSLGLSANCTIIKGSMDQTMGAVGALNVVPGTTSETTGSALVLALSAPANSVGPALKLPYQPHVVPATRIIMPFHKTAGILYRWFATELCGYSEDNLEAAYQDLNRGAERVPAGAEGLFVLPHFAGLESAPEAPESKGVLIGLTLRHTRFHIARAIQESIAYLLRDTVRRVQEAGIEVTQVRSLGGGARSDGWLRIKASVTGLPVTRMAQDQAPSLGAAAAAATALGDYESVASAAAAMIREGDSFRPDPGDYTVYQRGYLEFQRLGSTIASLSAKEKPWNN